MFLGCSYHYTSITHSYWTFSTRKKKSFPKIKHLISLQTVNNRFNQRTMKQVNAHLPYSALINAPPLCFTMRNEIEWWTAAENPHQTYTRFIHTPQTLMERLLHQSAHIQSETRDKTIWDAQWRNSGCASKPSELPWRLLPVLGAIV